MKAIQSGTHRKFTPFLLTKLSPFIWRRYNVPRSARKNI
jgi:hypothetical protein